MPEIHWREINPQKNKAEGRNVRWADAPVRKDLYQVLQLSPNACPEVIKAAYRALMEKYHPDKHPEHRRAWAEETSRQLNAAYAILGNARKREEYDAANGFTPGA
jgi:curved DNA-binding protein CbpA